VSRTVYVNGAFLPESEGQVSIFDRGLLFSDAVYEVTAVLEGGLVDFDAHQARLRRSLGEMSIAFDPEAADLLGIHRELVKRNHLGEGLVYLQISRGEADRSFVQPKDGAPTLILFTQAMSLANHPDAARGLRVMTGPDLRWHRRDIKTTQLLYPSMMKTAALEAGVDDVWMVENGFVTEGSSSNAHILTHDDRLITRHLSSDILGGITRAAVLAQAEEAGLTVETRPFTVDEALTAREAFITSATAFVTPVIEIDGHPVNDGHPGPQVAALRQRYLEESRRRLQ